MKKTIHVIINRSIVVMLLLMAVLVGCTSDFEEINTDVTQTRQENVVPNFFVAPVISRGPMGDLSNVFNIQFIQLDMWVQYFANYGRIDGTSNNGGTTTWWNKSVGDIENLNRALATIRSTGEVTNDEHIARIMKVYIFQRLVGVHGPIPYFEMADLTGNNPNYDDEDVIYQDMLKELEEAAAALSNDNPTMPPEQDRLFRSDIEKWKKFAQSLRLKIAMRLSEVDPELARSHAEAAVAAGVIESVEDNGLIDLGPEFGWGSQNGYATYQFGWGNPINMSRSFENTLIGLGGIDFPEAPDGETYIIDDPGVPIVGSIESSLDPNRSRFRQGVPSKVDPRGPLYFDNLGFSVEDSATLSNDQRVNVDNQWTGNPAGINPVDLGKEEYNTFYYASLGDNYANSERDYEVAKYHEVLFLRAEMALKGWNAQGDAKSFYEEGIRQSMLWHEVDPSLIDAYINSTDQNVYGLTVNFDFDSGETLPNGLPADSKLAKIITQKYIGCFPDFSWEAFADFRKTQYPFLIPFADPNPAVYNQGDLDAANPNAYPRRIRYPNAEAVNNAEKYEQAVEFLGGSELENVPLYYDPNK
ncbi:MAG: SusD/RagB family nutrient-binding outer membrane lipoprotein [Cytophagales bacterium]|nr:SusD/RagB family nutrient-binding outer membrane lipoprotein [Cytophagales bacterium]